MQPDAGLVLRDNGRMDNEHAAIEQAYLRERGQVLATLIGWLGDIDRAEEALQDALVAALEHWVHDGIPNNPGAWLTTTARRKAIDHMRKQSRVDGFEPEQLESLPPAALVSEDTTDTVDEIPDERLKLIFTCCHPALPSDQQVALTLHTLGGLTTAEIAAAFLVPLPTMAQRLVRAKKKIKEAGIPFQVPAAHLLAQRMGSVAAVIYLIFTEGYSASEGDALIRHDLCDEAIRLARVLEFLMKRESTTVPREQAAEVLGLLALMLLHHSRRQARVGDDGELVLLPDQDRSKWNQNEIGEGLALLDKALLMRVAGPYQIQAAIGALHAQAEHADATDWPQIAGLYEELLRHLDTPVIRLNGAVAVSMARGPREGLRVLDATVRPEQMLAFFPYHVARADMLRRAGHIADARSAYGRALDLSQNRREREAIIRQLAALGTDLSPR